VVSKSRLAKQVDLWRQHLPYIKPFYAVKSNDNAALMKWMIELFGPKNVGFDCASILEMEAVRKLTKQTEIIYAQPCKTRTDIEQSIRHGIRTTVVDSPEEMVKMGQSAWKGDVLIRLLVPDSNSKQPFGRKFGAPLQWVPEILQLAKEYRIPVKGLSFHVGSECENPDQFARALKVCRLAMEIGTEMKTNMDTIDIGGGFLPNRASFSAISSALETSRHLYFPNNLAPSQHPIRWIAEPGRFLSSTTHTLYTPVIGRKRGPPADNSTSGAPEFRYTLHESIYGFFSNVPFDGQKPTFEIAHKTNKPLVDRKFRSILFGRTCDGADIICPEINLPVLDEGDWLKVDNMGAYTSVSASEFNGFPKPYHIYDDDAAAVAKIDPTNATKA
jgi:ornithine decarboxylase